MPHKIQSKNRIQYVKRNLLWEILYNIETAILPFIVRTFMIKYLGLEYLGLNGLCASILSVLNLASMGIDSAVVFFMYESYAKYDVERTNALLKFYRHINRLISLAIFVGGLAVMPFLTLFVSSDLPNGINIYLIFFCYLLNGCLSYETAFYEKAIFNASQRWDYHIKNALFSSLILNLAQLLLIYKRQYYASVWMMIACTLLEAFLVHRVFRKNYSDFSCQGNISRALKNQIWEKVKGIVVYRLRDASRNSFDSAILSYYFGLVQLANYQNYVTILTVPTLLRGIFLHSVGNSVGNFQAVESRENVYSLYKILLFIHLTASGWFAVIFYSLIDGFIAIWIGQEYIFSDLITISFTVYFYIMGFAEIGYRMRAAFGTWEQEKLLAAIEAATNLILNIILARYLGIAGIILATVITILVIYIPCEARVIVKGYLEKGYRESVGIVVKNIIWILLSAGVVFIIQKFIPEIYFIKFIINAGVASIVPLVTFFLLYNHTDEYQYIWKILKSSRKAAPKQL